MFYSRTRWFSLSLSGSLPFTDPLLFLPPPPPRLSWKNTNIRFPFEFEFFSFGLVCVSYSSLYNQIVGNGTQRRKLETVRYTKLLLPPLSFPSHPSFLSLFCVCVCVHGCGAPQLFSLLRIPEIWVTSIDLYRSSFGFTSSSNYTQTYIHTHTNKRRTLTSSK